MRTLGMHNVFIIKLIIFMEQHSSYFTDFFSQELNAEQQKAVAHKDGVLLVCAGAGSGKTRVITARIAHLIIKHNVTASSIIALTFTNKAAREMKERVQSFLPHNSTLPFVGTFHSYCLQLLKTYNDSIRVPHFAILDSDDQEKLIKNIIVKNALQKRITAKTVLGAISRLKNESTTGSLDFGTIPDHMLRTVVQTYEREKTLAKCLDFDDLMLDVLLLFKKHPEIKERHQKRIRHILVDEYQDTNLIQHALLHEFTCSAPKTFCIDSLCVVGDEDQAIYSWRGATIANILNFAQDFPHTVRITIDQNYRSVQPILETANHVIRNNNQRHEKKLWSVKTAHDRIRILTCATGSQEGDVIAHLAKQQQAQEKLSHTAVLYRSHYQSRVVEEALIRHSVPYKIIGGIQFYERQEIKDLLAYLKLILNPHDRISFLRSINTPGRGLGDKFQELFLETWEQNPFATMTDIGLALLSQSNITQARTDGLQKYLTCFSSWNRTSNAYSTLQDIIKQTEFYSYLKTAFDEKDAETRIENVKELVQAVAALETRGITTVEAFLEEVTLLQAQNLESDETHGTIKLMTLHAAKGLEFDCVALTGLEEGILPSTHAQFDADAVEEERRLLYVGITRARERLLITHAHVRTIFGTTNEQRTSRFIRELPAHHVQREDVSRWPTYQIIHYLTQWVMGTAHIQPAQSLATAEFSQEKQKHSLFTQKQRVMHKIFGAGIIETVEERDDATYVTVTFNGQRKRLDARFIQKI